MFNSFLSQIDWLPVEADFSLCDALEWVGQGSDSELKGWVDREQGEGKRRSQLKTSSSEKNELDC